MLTFDMNAISLAIQENNTKTFYRVVETKFSL